MFKVDEKDIFEVQLDDKVATLSNPMIQHSDNILKYIFSKSEDFHEKYTSGKLQNLFVIKRIFPMFPCS